MSTWILEGKFVPADLDCSDFANLDPLYQDLLDRPIGTIGELEEWLIDLSDLSCVVSEFGARRNIDLACHTEDKEIEAAYMNFVENVHPKISPVFFKLQKKLLDCPHLDELVKRDPRLELLKREWEADVEIFRDENVPIFTEMTRLTTEYNKIRGAMSVTFRGDELTLQQLARFLEETDRATRQEAWELSEQRQSRDVETENRIFEQLLEKRQQVSVNAGLANFRDYSWKAKARFDYTPEDCLAFGDTIEKLFMPLVRKLDEDRAGSLGLEKLRPWDLSVDPRGRPPLRPFDPKDIPGFINRTGDILSRVDPMLAQEFRTLDDNGNLDLDSRKAKRPGGFQSTLYAVRQPFIFMNAAGSQRDVDTLLHEAGHAFHMLWAKDEPVMFLRHAPLEFCEVASMAMELLCCSFYDTFYGNQADADRAKRHQLEGIIRFFPWMATVDGFQHWLYTHPGHTRDQRDRAWLEISGRFSSPMIDWTGWEDVRRNRWHRQIHIFCYPFYYIEYGMAQIGALQVWRRYRSDPEAALGAYRRALSLGGTRTLPELFDQAGIRFDFSETNVRPLVDMLQDQIAALPE
ncbi:MAG: M3 family oligoendopeptidase [Phycisphaeraceae bacterium]|nr:M3 family oligoendopeptidase [Phycisphaeraceae bacterium]